MGEVSNITAGDTAAPPTRTSGGVRTATITDARGRKIAIHKLTPVERLTLFETLGAALSDNTRYLGYAMSAACVDTVDGVRHVIDSKKAVVALVRELADAGLDAIDKAYREHFDVGETGEPEVIKK